MYAVRQMLSTTAIQDVSVTRRPENKLGDVTAAILAGGLGTRLRTVAMDRQKVVAEVAGRPFLFFVLNQLNEAGLRKVVLCVGHLAGQVEAELGRSFGSLRLRYSHETSPLGTGGALRHALDLIESDHVLVLNGDSFCSVDLAAVYAKHLERGADLTLVLTHVADTSRFGHVCLDAEDRVTAFREKHASGGPGWVNAGVYFMSRGMLEDITPEASVSLEREVFPRWVNRTCFGYRSSGSFIDIGTPESYHEAQELLRVHPA